MKINKFNLLAVGLMAAAAPAFADPSYCDTISGNLVQNCGFEVAGLGGANVFAGWTNSPTTSNPGVYQDFGGPNSGNADAAFNATGFDASLSQTVSDTAGQQYTLSFFLANDGGWVGDFTAKWNGQALLSIVNQPTSPIVPYTEYSFLVTGTGGDTIEFLGRDDPGTIHLDDVSLSIPEPSFMWLGGLLLAGVLLKFRRSLAEVR